MIVVHHLENSRSQRVLWALEELGLDYRIETYRRDPATLRGPDALRAVHPLGKSPVLVDGDRVLAESGAILEYLVERHDPEGRLAAPDDEEGRQRYRYWMHYAEGSAMPPLLMNLMFSRMRSAPAPFFLRPLVRSIADRVMERYVMPQIVLHFDWMESELGRSTWFSGERLTAADIQMSFPVEAAAARSSLLEQRPRLAAFLERVRGREAYRRAVDKGGAFALLH